MCRAPALFLYQKLLCENSPAIPSICFVPIKSHLVLPGFTNKLFEQHQVVILFISSESLVAAVGNDKNILESSTYDSSDSLGTLGKSSIYIYIYILKSTGPRI